MATRNQLNPPPLRKITDFKSKLTGGGARSNLFEVELSFPAAVSIAGLNDILNKARFMVKAAALPACYEPLLVSDEAVLRDIVEEELLLALPSFPTHEAECKTNEQVAALEPLNASYDEVTEVRAQRDNPFDVLEQLKN